MAHSHREVVGFKRIVEHRVRTAALAYPAAQLRILQQVVERAPDVLQRPAEKAQGTVVGEHDLLLRINGDHALRHVVQHGVQAFPVALLLLQQCAGLAVQLVDLLIDRIEFRLTAVGSERFILPLVERAETARHVAYPVGHVRRKAPSQQRGQHQRQYQRQQQEWQSRQQEGADLTAPYCQPDDNSLPAVQRGRQGVVRHGVPQRCGVALYRVRFARQRRDHLRAVGVILGRGRVGAVLVQHIARPVNDRDAELVPVGIIPQAVDVIRLLQYAGQQL